ncbi:hypothetical protein CEXT_543511 [Caerostris extrusa]|uniref:Uncharacterized protein n=1 Tax=Caerostris extrusa TaxID=172846 RepID=A0AAV4VG65_CAEEX|nr:hypothetical protein CEXT_543511 [Caerostris extrusa]
MSLLYCSHLLPHKFDAAVLHPYLAKSALGIAPTYDHISSRLLYSIPIWPNEFEAATFHPPTPKYVHTSLRLPHCIYIWRYNQFELLHCTTFGKIYPRSKSVNSSLIPYPIESNCLIQLFLGIDAKPLCSTWHVRFQNKVPERNRVLVQGLAIVGFRTKLSCQSLWPKCIRYRLP